MAQSEVQGPAKPHRITVAVQREGDRLRLAYRRREWGVGAFMLLWLTGWTVGCVFLAGLVIQQPQLFNLMFAVPFWASWLFVFAMVAKSFFQHEEMLLDRTGANYVRKVLFPLHVRTVPLREIRSVDRFTTVTDSESGQSESGIEVRTLGLPLRMLQGLSGPELDWLERLLNDHLSALGEVCAPREPPAQEAVAEDEASELEDGARVALSIASRPVCPPSDCRWRRVDGFDDFRFATRGRFGWGCVLGLTFLNTFWNGIVSVFVMHLWGAAPDGAPPQGAEWWGLFLFLVPFEVIGLVMLVALVAAVFEPVHRTVWTLERQGVDYRTSWLGLGPHWTWEVVRLDRIELRRDTKRGRPRWSGTAPSLAASAGSRDYRLSLVDRSNAEVCSIDGLTEGEARWIGDIVLRERAAWFR
jgi:hypothetical protein